MIPFLKVVLAIWNHTIGSMATWPCLTCGLDSQVTNVNSMMAFLGSVIASTYMYSTTRYSTYSLIKVGEQDISDIIFLLGISLTFLLLYARLQKGNILGDGITPP